MRGKFRQRDVVKVFLVLSHFQDEDILIAVVSDHVVVNSRRNPAKEGKEGIRMSVGISTDRG